MSNDEFSSINEALSQKKPIVPFLGPGLSNNIEIRLAKLLIGKLGNPLELMGYPTSVCYEEPEERPFYCPLLKNIPSNHGSQEEDRTCPRVKELQLAVARMTVRLLSEYKQCLSVSVSEDSNGDSETTPKTDVSKLYECLRKELSKNGEENCVQNQLSSIDKVVAKIWNLNPDYPLIITTNYDDVLENAFGKTPYGLIYYVADLRLFIYRDKEKEEIKVRHLNNRVQLPTLGKCPIILKLHGILKDKFVVTESQHIDYLGNAIDNLLPATLIRKIQKSHILFLGYSPNDPDLQVIIRRFWQGKKITQQSWFVYHQKRNKYLERYWGKNVEFIESSVNDLIANLEFPK